jgi:chitodextrinase
MDNAQTRARLRRRVIIAVTLAVSAALLVVVAWSNTGSASARDCHVPRTCPAAHHEYLWRGLSCTSQRRLRTAVDRTVVVYKRTRYYCHRVPARPAGLHVTGITDTSVALAWARARSQRVAGFGLFLDGMPAGFVHGTTFTFSELTCGKSYLLAVRAREGSGRRSRPASVRARTSACPAAAPVAPPAAPPAQPPAPGPASTPTPPEPAPAPPDTQAPTTPRSLKAGSATPTSVVLSWAASTDDVGVAGYSLLLDGAQQSQTTTSTSFTFAGLTCSTKHTLGVQAFDAAGNVSATATSSARTANCPAPAPSGNCPSKPLQGVQDPGHLKVIDRAHPCRTAVGRVTSTAPQADGDCHIKVTVDAQYTGLLNSANNGSLVVEVIPNHKLPIPKPGSRVSIVGTWVKDLGNGWNELHPAWSFQMLSGSSGGC